MILPYYTVAFPNRALVDPHESIGGFVSTTIVANAQLNALFPDVGGQDDTFLVRCIALVNTGSQSANSITLTINDDCEFVQWTVAATSPDTTGKFQRLTNDRSIPYGVSFVDASTSVSLGNLAPQAALALWLKRDVDVIEVREHLSLQQFEVRFADSGSFGPLPITSQSCNIIISWT